MKTSQLELLPLEILGEISLQLLSMHEPSLYQFSLVSKRCHAGTSKARFSILRIRVSVRTELKSSIQKWLDFVTPRGYFPNLRRVEIKGFMINSSNDYGRLDSETIYNSLVREYAGLTREEENYAWEPLVEAIASFSRFEHLVWNTESPFPMVLFSYLSKSRPRCRLTFDKFEFRFFSNGTVFPQEASLLGWPFIDRLTVTRVNFGLYYRNVHAQNTVLKAVTGLAQGVKELEIVCPACHSHPSGTTSDPLFPPFQSIQDDITIPRRCSLTTLKLINGYITPELMEICNSRIDFSHLTALVLKGRVANGFTLSSAELSLPNLETLELDLARINPEDTDFALTLNAIPFLDSLPPLRNLRIRGLFGDEIFEYILKHHCATLRQLSLIPTDDDGENLARFKGGFHLTGDKARQLRQACPLLKELDIEIRRTYSDANEAGIYRALGEFTHMRKLCLTMDCSGGLRGIRLPDKLPLDAEFDEFDKKWHVRGVRNGHVRHALTNSAIDRDLAISIWHILTTQQKHSALQHLHLKPQAWKLPFRSVDHAMPKVLGFICQEISLRRAFGKSDSGEITVKYEQYKHRLPMIVAARDNEARLLRENRDHPELLGSCQEVFRRIWPVKESGVDWRDDWSSLPFKQRYISSVSFNEEQGASALKRVSYL
jgi:hypothetical protein